MLHKVFLKVRQQRARWLRLSRVWSARLKPRLASIRGRKVAGGLAKVGLHTCVQSRPVLFYLVNLYVKSGYLSKTTSRLFFSLNSVRSALGNSPFVFEPVANASGIVPHRSNLYSITKGVQVCRLLVFLGGSAAGFRWSEARSGGDFFSNLASVLKLSYFVQYQAIDRKLRKIVKNKYRYVRRYLSLRVGDRLRYGLRLIPVASSLYPNRRWEDKVFMALHDLFMSRDASPLFRLWQKHQHAALQALGLR